MNLFRVAIDGATGGPSGAPEQVTTSVGNLGWARFSADGRRLVAAVYERSAELHLYRLTPFPRSDLCVRCAPDPCTGANSPRTPSGLPARRSARPRISSRC